MAKTLEDTLFETLGQILATLSNGEMSVSISSIDDPEGVDTIINNTSSNPVPVQLVNPSDAIDLEVNANISQSITIDDSTPVDVNVTNTVNTNATIQGTPNVNITNTNLDPVNATLHGNPYVRLLNTLSNGKTPVYIDGLPPVVIANTTLGSRKFYTSGSITALATSTDVNLWTAALADGMLTKEFVDTYQNEYEQITLYTHPDLGDGDKALKKITQYSAQNNGTVIESVDYKIVDWDKDSLIQGSVSISAGAITSPNINNASVPIHTVVTTLSITDNTLGNVTLSLSGANASLYHLHEVETGTHSQTSLTYVQGRTYQVHAHSNFPTSSSYSHSFTVVATGDVFGVTDSVNIQTSGTLATTSSYENTKYMQGSPAYTVGGVYKKASTVNGGLLTSTNNFNDYANRQTYNFWYYKPSSYTGEIALLGDFNTASNGNVSGYCFFSSSSYGDLVFYTNYGTSYKYAGITLPSGYEDQWIMVTFVTDTTLSNSVYYLQNSTTFNNTAYSATLTSGSGSQYSITTSTSVTDSGFFGARTYNQVLFPSTSSGMSSNTFKIDEYTAFNKALTLTEIEELYNSFVPYDYTTHSASSDLYRYIRFGDNANDSESSLQCKVDSSFVLTKDSSISTTYIPSLTSSDSPYVPASGTFVNSYYLQESVSNSMQSYFSDISPRSDQKFCLSFWMKSSQFNTSAPSGGQRIFGNVGYNGGTGSSNGFQLRRKSGTTTTYECFFSSGTYYLVADFTVTNVSSLNNQWVHILVNYDYDSSANSGAINRTIFTNSCDLYINGSACNKTASTVYESTTHSTQDIDHGVNQGYWSTGSSVQGFVNSYDELAYWNNTSLSSSEIALVYNSGNKVIDLENTSNLTTPTYWWRHEDSSNINLDTITQSNKGTITNATRTAY